MARMKIRERVARHRAAGVRVEAVLTDPADVDAWRALVAKHGGVKPALTALLRHSERSAK